ncbi:MAG: LacI family DNA-binding transcriptional regulator [Clostridia bacterium]|nr:LacI family DNA-binding transcriptional regulator [Clostridia bacterium]
MTLAKIAKIANVAVSTVSKAFSDSPEISKETKEQIIKIAKDTGCFEKYYKPKYNKKLIAVICPEMLGVHYSQMSTYLEEKITKRNGTMLLSVSSFSPEKQAELIDYYIKYAHADGIIVIEPISKIKNSTEVPIIQIGLEKATANVHAIYADMGDALSQSINLLLKEGHHNIGFIGEQYTAKEYEIFLNTAASCGVANNPEFVSINNHRFQDCGYYGIDEMIKKGSLPTAVFAAYSHIAVGILQRLSEENLRVPEDISVVCLDDISTAPYGNRKLSCIKMHLEELCSEAVHLLYRLIAKKHNVSKHTITVERQFFKGETIGKKN